MEELNFLINSNAMFIIVIIYTCTCNSIISFEVLLGMKTIKIVNPFDIYMYVIRESCFDSSSSIIIQIHVLAYLLGGEDKSGFVNCTSRHFINTPNSSIHANVWLSM